MTLTPRTASRFGLLARRLSAVLAAYAFVMQVFFASALAAQAAAWSGAGPLAVICKGETQPGAAGGGGNPHQGHVDCGLACWGMANAGVVPVQAESSVTRTTVVAFDSPLLAPPVQAASEARDGDARAPPLPA